MIHTSISADSYHLVNFKSQEQSFCAMISTSAGSKALSPSGLANLRWEVRHKLSKDQKKPLTDAQVHQKQCQIDAYEKRRIAAGGKPFRSLNKKIDALPEKTAKAVVVELLSLENTPGLDVADQIDEDCLKIHLLQTRVKKNKRLQTHGKLRGKWARWIKPSRKHNPEPHAKRARTHPLPQECISPTAEAIPVDIPPATESASSTQSSVTAEPSEEELKRQWLARERAAQEAQDELQRREELDLKRRKREFELEHRYDHQCLGCKRHFAWEEQYHEHMINCKKYLNLPMDKFGFRRGEEPDSPTLQKVWRLAKKDEHDFWLPDSSK